MKDRKRPPDPGYEYGHVVVGAVTDAAFLIEGDEEWVPFSQIMPDSEIGEGCDKGDEGILVVTTWIARKKGWLE